MSETRPERRRAKVTIYCEPSGESETRAGTPERRRGERRRTAFIVRGADRRGAPRDEPGGDDLPVPDLMLTVEEFDALCNRPVDTQKAGVFVPLYRMHTLRPTPEGTAGADSLAGGDEAGKARAWSAVFALCRDLGMLETRFPRTEPGVTGRGTVLDFIRHLAFCPTEAATREKVICELRQWGEHQAAHLLDSNTSAALATPEGEASAADAPGVLASPPGEAPFALPVRVEESFEMDDGCAYDVVDADGVQVTFDMTRAEADFIARALNATAPRSEGRKSAAWEWDDGSRWELGDCMAGGADPDSEVVNDQMVPGFITLRIVSAEGVGQQFRYRRDFTEGEGET